LLPLAPPVDLSRVRVYQVRMNIALPSLRRALAAALLLCCGAAQADWSALQALKSRYGARITAAAVSAWSGRRPGGGARSSGGP